jgi:purine-cytosine permease-like protein
MPQTTEKNKLLPPNVRVMIGLVASPTLMVVGMLFYTLFTDGWQSVSVAMIIFTLLCIFAYFVAFTGHLPRLRSKKKSQAQ